jgi:hypothetical protein
MGEKTEKTTEINAFGHPNVVRRPSPTVERSEIALAATATAVRSKKIRKISRIPSKTGLKGYKLYVDRCRVGWYLP